MGSVILSVSQAEGQCRNNVYTPMFTPASAWPTLKNDAEVFRQRNKHNVVYTHFGMYSLKKEGNSDMRWYGWILNITTYHRLYNTHNRNSCLFLRRCWCVPGRGRLSSRSQRARRKFSEPSFIRALICSLSDLITSIKTLTLSTQIQTMAKCRYFPRSSDQIPEK